MGSLKANLPEGRVKLLSSRFEVTRHRLTPSQWPEKPSWFAGWLIYNKGNAERCGTNWGKSLSVLGLSLEAATSSSVAFPKMCYFPHDFNDFPHFMARKRDKLNLGGLGFFMENMVGDPAWSRGLHARYHWKPGVLGPFRWLLSFVQNAPCHWRYLLLGVDRWWYMCT